MIYFKNILKKAVSIGLACMLMTGMATSTMIFADTYDSTYQLIEGTIRVLGIMTGDETGNMNLSKNVTREEFAKMVVMASSEKDNVSENSSYSVFNDVKSNRWSASYIKTAVDLGLFNGYLDGSFKPENNITLEEAATVSLKLLGYTNADFTGTYPSGQLSKFEDLELDENIDKNQGDYLTRQDCIYLFYNILNAETKSGQIYAQTLGYMTTSAGEIDYNTLLVTETEGPVIVENSAWTSELPFSTIGVTVYRDGVISNINAIEMYDVVYYVENIRTLWVYSDKAIGTYTLASPSTISPSNVTVGGNSYTLNTSEAKLKLSSIGEFSTGDSVALLLDATGGVVDVISASEINSTSIGIVNGSNKIVTEDNDVKYQISVVGFDGNVETHQYDTSVSFGKIVTVEYEDGEVKIRTASSKDIDLSDYDIAQNAEIIDINENGEFALVYPNRIQSNKVDSDDVLYYSLNSDGEIDRLILDDITGDIATYGIVTGVQEIDQTVPNANTGGTDVILQGYYEILINGSYNSHSTKNKILNIESGPAMFTYENGVIDSIKSLDEFEVDAVNGMYLSDDNLQIAVSDDVQVYLKDGSSYYITSLSEVDSLSDYELTAYTDSGFELGNLVRIVIAEKK